MKKWIFWLYRIIQVQLHDKGDRPKNQRQPVIRVVVVVVVVIVVEEAEGRSQSLTSSMVVSVTAS